MTSGRLTKTKVPTPSHRDICRATASIGAHLRCGNWDKANEWSHVLMKYMKDMGLLKEVKE
jgi:hypothetical protein